jgi:hypothetical protein
MKYIAIFLSCIHICLSQVSFNGNVNYIKQNSDNLSSNNNIAYKFKLYEDYKYLITFSNILSVDLDVFKNEIKETNVFTTLQIEF